MTFEEFKTQLETENDILRQHGWEWRGNAQKVFNKKFGRWLPTTDFWNKPMSTEVHERGIWHTRQEALKAVAS